MNVARKLELAQRLARARSAVIAAERAYTAPAYAAALEAVEDLPPHHGEAIFLRAAVAHALAELRADASLLREAIAGYGRAAPMLPRAVAARIPELLADCHEQMREMGERSR
jgi:hypothetical protein